jgi:hypothetical protein
MRQADGLPDVHGGARSTGRTGALQVGFLLPLASASLCRRPL